MKRLLAFIFCAITLSPFFSCERCTTCTYQETRDSVLTSEVCQKGRAYKNQVELYERNDWDCEE